MFGLKSVKRRQLIWIIAVMSGIVMILKYVSILPNFFFKVLSYHFDSLRVSLQCLEACYSSYE